ncbi:MAG: hypothetical protein SO046_01310 [Actinomyces urogenitalis]|uniref:arsenate reductase/protein-tyrosine-phosphatase family protein n=1 Tax=Actinomyces urogenitalis TaxID=103621 RepID=UPI002A8418AC|nr:hypothetical protein [Actinomyces urogenitalis]MDY3677846.1 hypothetical protein [Actinomyces urogenitalis]
MSHLPRPSDFGAAGLFDDLRTGTPPPLGGGAPLLLFVCTANISRSPYAELLTRRALGTGSPWVVASAGVPGTTGRPMDPQMSPQAQRRGVPSRWCQAHRSRPVSRDLLTRAWLVIAMEKRQRDAVLDIAPSVHARLLTLHQVVVAAASLGVSPGWDAESLVAALFRRKPVVSSRDDVPDPYRQAPEVVERACTVLDKGVGTLTGLLRLTA